MARSVVLLSGGLDSTVNLTRAVAETDVDTALYFDFGQRAASREARAVRSIAAALGVKLRTISLNWLENITRSAIVDEQLPLPEVARFEDLDTVPHDSFVSDLARQVWVPNRLGLFINIGASFAEAQEADYIIMGLNNTRGATSPDHASPFYQAVNDALANSTLGAPQVVSYTGGMTKAEIVAHGQELGAPLDKIWDCYTGDAKMCGRCESCARLVQAMQQAGAEDWWWSLRLMRPRGHEVG